MNCGPGHVGSTARFGAARPDAPGCHAAPLERLGRRQDSGGHCDCLHLQISTFQAAAKASPLCRSGYGRVKRRLLCAAAKRTDVRGPFTKSLDVA